MKSTRLIVAATLVAAAAACSAHPAAPEPGGTAAGSAIQADLLSPAANQTEQDSVQPTGETGIVGSVGG